MGFRMCYWDERLETEHRNELEAGDWEVVGEGRLRTIVPSARRLFLRILLLSECDTIVRDECFITIQGGFALQDLQYSDAHVVCEQTLLMEGYPRRISIFLLALPSRSRAEWVGFYAVVA